MEELTDYLYHNYKLSVESHTDIRYSYRNSRPVDVLIIDIIGDVESKDLYIIQGIVVDMINLPIQQSIARTDVGAQIILKAY